MFISVFTETEDILTYEEVTRYYPQPNRKRPIVLIGPADVGRQELRERVMESDFERFAAAVPREFASTFVSVTVVSVGCSLHIGLTFHSFE